MSPLLLWIGCANQPGDGIIKAAAGTDLFEMSSQMPERVFEIDVVAQTEGNSSLFFEAAGEATLVEGNSGVFDVLLERDDDGRWIPAGAAFTGTDVLGGSFPLAARIDGYERHHSCDDDCEARYRYTLTGSFLDGTFVAAVWFRAQITHVDENDDAAVEVTFTEIE